jgi:hypothetical protein
MRRLRTQNISDGRNDFSPHAYAAEHVVRRDLAGDLAEEWGLGTEYARVIMPQVSDIASVQAARLGMMS